MTTTILARQPGQNFATFLHGWLEPFRQERAKRTIYNRVYSELMAHSNRDLSDIGIDRADIPEIAQQAATATA